MSVLDEVGLYVDASTPLTLGQDLFLGQMADKPDSCVGLYEFTSGPPAYTMGGDGRPAWELPRIQVMTRAIDYQTARDTAGVVTRVLEQITDDDLNGVRWMRVERISGPSAAGRDDDRRYLVTTNFMGWRTPP